MMLMEIIIIFLNKYNDPFHTDKSSPSLPNIGYFKISVRPVIDIIFVCPPLRRSSCFQFNEEVRIFD